MKRKSFTHILIVALMAMANQAYAQYPTIDSLKIIPVNPTDDDHLKIVCYSTFPYGSCQLNNFSYHLQQGNMLTISLDYTVGNAAYICHSIDTVPFENPGMGEFQLRVQLLDQDILYNQLILPFTVIRGSLGIPELSRNKFEVYPNPFNKELKFKTNFEIKTLEIQALSGQKIQLIESVQEDSGIDVSNLKQGIYLVTLTDPSGNKSTQRIIKN